MERIQVSALFPRIGVHFPGITGSPLTHREPEPAELGADGAGGGVADADGRDAGERARRGRAGEVVAQPQGQRAAHLGRQISVNWLLIITLTNSRF